MRKLTEMYTFNQKLWVKESPSGVRITGKVFMGELAELGVFAKNDIESVLDWAKAVGLDRISIKGSTFDVNKIRVLRTHRDDSSRIRGNQPLIRWVIDDVATPSWELQQITVLYLDWYETDAFGTTDSEGIIILQMPESEEWRLMAEPPEGIEFPRSAGEFATLSALIEQMASSYEYDLRRSYSERGQKPS